MPLPGISRSDGVDYEFRRRYDTLRSLLKRNVVCLEILSDLEADLSHLNYYDSRVQRSTWRLVDEATLMAQELNLVASNRYGELYAVLERMRRQVSASFSEIPHRENNTLAVALDDAASMDVSLVGGKAQGLALLRRYLPDSVPAGFTITTASYRRLLQDNDLKDRIMLMLQDIGVVADRDQFRSRIDTIRSWISSASIPDAVRRAIHENANRAPAEASGRWAVRSSAVDEDGRYSFAGLFDSLLGVDTGDLESAYLRVLASRFTERALRYRLNVGLREVEVPMAVLFMPFVDASAKGVIHTSDTREPSRRAMVVYAMPGPGDAGGGAARGHAFRVSKSTSPEVLDVVPVSDGMKFHSRPEYVDEDAIRRLSRLAIRAEEAFGHALEMEWAVDERGSVRLLQARRLQTIERGAIGGAGKSKTRALVEGGVTVFPGQAEGKPVSWTAGTKPDSVPAGAVLVVDEPTPELVGALAKAAAVVAAAGHPAGHVSNLAREFSVPCVFRMGSSLRRILAWNVVSVDATHRAVYGGSLWPGMRERVAERIASQPWRSPSGPLHDLVIKLNLYDPDSSSFKARSCRSAHDVLRFVHEMAVRSMFGFGDRSRRGGKGRRHELDAELPVKIALIDLDGSIPVARSAVSPLEIDSIPFQAFWRGVSDDRLRWTERWRRAMPGVPESFRAAVLDNGKGPRRASDRNYAMIASNYMNLNTRFSYHYAMVDAIVGPGPGSESNHVHFSFRGGGAGDEKRERRAHFLELVLRGIGFGTSRRGDMMTAWFSRYPFEKSQEALEQLGRLTVCAGELDAEMDSDESAGVLADKFLRGEYEVFL